MSTISVITSLGLGALHALEPGHGKTFLVSYSIANTIDKKETVKIISSMAISHSLLLLVLGIVIPVFLPKQSEDIHFFVQLTASLLVLYVGFKMLYRWNKKESEKCSCGQNHSLKEHNESLYLGQHTTGFTAASLNAFKVNGISLASNANPKNTLESKKNGNPILVGIVNGIMPCPSALAIVGIAFTYSSAWAISLVMIAYVLGFIAAMFALLIAFVKFKNKFLKSKTNHINSQRKIQLVSAIVIILSGYYYLFLAFNHSH